MEPRGLLIGRERELAVLEAWLGSVRLITVTGPGGCGKTRVALELAERALSRPDPEDVVVVQLATAWTADQCVDALLRSLGSRERGGRTREQILIDCLTERTVLLVLDNCEHITVEVRRVVDTLVAGTRGVRVLVTSREPLGLDAEAVFQLEPLSLPDAEGDVGAIVRSDAGRFFVDRATTADRGFALTPTTARSVARICVELDGLPLAIGLAAARVKHMAPSEIADGLSRRGRLSGPPSESAVPQHRSIRASLDWSYALLTEEERSLMRRLSSFVGGWTAEAARAVALPQASETRVRDLLDGLSAKGLIVDSRASGSERWSFLQTVGEYAAQQFALDDDAEEVGDRHLEWFAAYAAEADELLLDSRGPDLLNDETPNIRLALTHALRRNASAALDLVASLTRHWILAEHFEEGRASSADALSAAGVEGDASARAVVLCGAGLIGALSEDYQAAVETTRAGMALIAGVGDPGRQARCLQMSGMVLILTGLDLDEGLQSAKRAVDLLRAAGDPLGLAWAVANVAMAAGVCDDFEAARAAYDEFLSIPGAPQQPRLRTWAELAAAWVELIVGSAERAVGHADRALELEGDRPTMNHFLATGFRVHALALLGQNEDALDTGAKALSRAQEHGAAMAVPAIEMAVVIAELADGDLEAAAARARALVQMPQVHTVALMREALGRVALARGDSSEARAQARELDVMAGRVGSARHRALAELLRGSAAALDDDPDYARDCLQAALRTYADLGLERGAADALEELGLLDAAAGNGPRAARLAGAASAVRARLKCQSLVGSAERLEAARARFLAGNGTASWDEAWAQGEKLALVDAIAYAQRGRGRRGRPLVGWPSLTPAEREVADLAASGMSNPQIATQLFISRSTVKMHLSNTYLKLHIANRTELARAIATRSADGVPGDPSGQALARDRRPG